MKGLLAWVVFLIFIIAFGAACKLSGDLPGAPPEVLTPQGIGFAETKFPTETVLATLTPMSTIEVLIPDETVTANDNSTAESEPHDEILSAQTTMISTPEVTVYSEDQREPKTQLPPSELDNARLIFTDDFNTIGGWIPGSTENYEYGYEDEAYQFTIRVPELSLWNVRSQSYPNTRQEIEILDFEGSNDGFFGLICRWQRPNVYYTFTLSNSGQLKISKNIFGEVTKLISKDIPIAEIGYPIKLRADCNENGLWLFINEEVQLFTTDVDLDDGQFGIIAGSGEQAPFAVSVDNFKLFVP